MLSLERCRQILGDDAADSDAALEAIRESLYALADIAVDGCLRRRDGQPGNNAARRSTQGDRDRATGVYRRAGSIGQHDLAGGGGGSAGGEAHPLYVPSSFGRSF